MTHERRGKSDDWFTPKYIFDALGCIFDLDVAHPRDHTYTSVPALDFIYENSLDTAWPKEKFIWMNQPFGNGNRTKLQWLLRFFNHGNGIALTPDRTSAEWFRQIWPLADLCLFVPKIDFVRPDGSLGSEPGNGTSLWAIGDKGVAALCRAAPILRGILAKNAGYDL